MGKPKKHFTKLVRLNRAMSKFFVTKDGRVLNKKTLVEKRVRPFHDMSPTIGFHIHGQRVMVVLADLVFAQKFGLRNWTTTHDVVRLDNEAGDKIENLRLTRKAA